MQPYSSRLGLRPRSSSLSIYSLNLNPPFSPIPLFSTTLYTVLSNEQPYNTAYLSCKNKMILVFWWFKEIWFPINVFFIKMLLVLSAYLCFPLIFKDKHCSEIEQTRASPTTLDSNQPPLLIHLTLRPVLLTVGKRRMCLPYNFASNLIRRLFIHILFVSIQQEQ